MTTVGAAVTAVKSSRVLLEDQVIPAVIVIEDGKIHEIIPHGDFPADAGSKVTRLKVIILYIYNHLHNSVTECVNEFHAAAVKTPGTCAVFASYAVALFKVKRVML